MRSVEMEVALYLIALRRCTPALLLATVLVAGAPLAARNAGNPGAGSTKADGLQIRNRELIRAARKHGLAEVQAAIARGAQVDATDESGRTALMFAAYRNQLRTLDWLIENEASLDLRGARGFTALMYAAYRGNRAATLRLLAAGADYRLKNDEGRTAVDVALKENQLSIRRTVRTEFLGGRLFAAALRGDHPAMVRLLNDKADPNVRVEGVPVILAALRNADRHALKLLHAAGAKLGVRDEQGRDLLTVAIEVDESDSAPVAIRFAYPLASELILLGFRIDRRSIERYRQSVAEILAKPETDRGSDRLQLLLNAGATAPYGNSALADPTSLTLQCARGGRHRYLYQLLRTGSRQPRQLTQLFDIALEFEDARLARAALAATHLNGSEIVSLTRTNGRSRNFEPLRSDFLDYRPGRSDGAGPALVKAVALRRADVLRLLLERPPRNIQRGDHRWLNQSTPDGRSAVQHAFAHGRIDMLRMLLTAGADINHANRRGTTVLLRAIYSSQGEMIPELLALGADPDFRGMHGRTALWWAARLGRRDVVSRLLAAGALPNPVDDYGTSALEEATRAEFTQIVELIERKLKKGRVARISAQS